MESKEEKKQAYQEEGKRRMLLRKKKRNNKFISGYESRRRHRCYSPWYCGCSCSEY